MTPDLYNKRRLYLLHIWALGFARIFFVAGFVLLFAGSLTASLVFLGGWFGILAVALAISFLLRCQACGARQTITHISPPVHRRDGSFRNPLARMFYPDPIALGAFNCWSCEERFLLTHEPAA